MATRFPRPFLALFGFVSLAAGLSASADGLPGPDSNVRVWGKPVEGIELSAHLEGSTFSPTQPILLSLRVKPSGPASVVIGPVIGVYDVEITCPDGTIATLSPEGRAELEAYRLLPSCFSTDVLPGAIHKVPHADIQKLFGLNQPGEYQVVVWFRWPGHNQNGEKNSDVAVSNRLVFTIADEP